MKKKVIYILVVLLIIIGGYFAMGEYREKQLIEVAYSKAKAFLPANYEDINEVSFNKDNVFFDPLGGISIGGYVNDDDNLYFNMRFNLSDNKVGSVTSVFSPNDFPPEKEECKVDFCQ